MLEKEEITETGCERVEWIRRDGGFGEFYKNFDLHKDKGFGESCTTISLSSGTMGLFCLRIMEM